MHPGAVLQSDWSSGDKGAVSARISSSMEDLLRAPNLHTDYGHVMGFILDTHSAAGDTGSSSEDRFVEVGGSDQAASPLVTDQAPSSPLASSPPSSSNSASTGKAVKKVRGAKAAAKSRSRRSAKSVQSEDKEKRKANERNRVREVRKTYKELRRLLTHGQDSWDAKPIKISILDGAIDYISNLAGELAIVQSHPPPSQLEMYPPQPPPPPPEYGPQPSCGMEPPPESKPNMLLRGTSSLW